MDRQSSLTRRRFLLSCAVAALLGASGRRAEAQYTAVDLYTVTPPAGYVPRGDQSVTLGANDVISASGQVVGNADYPSGTPGSNITHAFLWTAGGAPIDLGAHYFAESTNAGQQVGELNTDSGYEAVLWNGSAAGVVSLHPAGFGDSDAVGTSGTQQVGWAVDAGGIGHAMLWNGTAASAVDLSPAGISGWSKAFGTDGTHQVGNVSVPANPTFGHAFLWSGTASSAVDLNPAGADGSSGNGVSGNQQVGYTITNGVLHAVLWTGSASSAVDLHPTNLSGFANSDAVATNGNQQVGELITPPDSNGNSTSHAVVWSGTASSAVDLHASLIGSFGNSFAQAIDGAGDVFGLAVDASSNYHAIEWLAPPHTATAAVAGGTSQHVSIAGRSPTAGDVLAAFQSFTPGTLTNISSLSTASDLASRTAALNFTPSGPAGLIQTWDLSFSGTFAGPTTLTFHYDPTELADGITACDLRIENFTDGQWVALDGTVDPAADTVTVSTDNFSSFALGAVPEPSTLALLLPAAAGLMLTRVRRTRPHS